MNISNIYGYAKSMNVDAMTCSYIINRTLGHINSNFILKDQEFSILKHLIDQAKDQKTCCKIFLEKDFYKLENIFVLNQVFEPRPDTETLVEHSIDILNNHSKNNSINKLNGIEFGIGSGVISISLIKELALNKIDLTMHGIDVNEHAVKNSIWNAKINQVEDKCNFQKINWKNINKTKTYDFIISNPPYVTYDEYMKNIDVLKHDPINACVSGKTGLECYQEIIEMSHDILKENGIIIFEIGINQYNKILQIAQNNNFKEISHQKDLSGIIRSLALSYENNN